MYARQKKMLIDALRSGEFAQHKGSLANEDLTAFCCLGVLCELHRREVGGTWKKEGAEYYYLSHDALLPIEVQEWAGLSYENILGSDNCPASYWNDGAGHNFETIANLIEHLVKTTPE